ncbi:MAG: prolipoprotein diacylglyceryl transferase, partial [Oscillospiraceae bacterium]|nr:prolipoprotein diacylglyceryl transferase [Oscillospiraceae bacterium]
FHACGRVGCFCAGCCYGREAAWGIAFTHAPGAPNGVPLVPVQLFEAGFNLLLMAAILIFKPERRRPGLLLPLYLAAYAAARFVLEFFRGDSGRGVLLLSTSQWISLLVILPAAIALFLRRNAGHSRDGVI